MSYFSELQRELVMFYRERNNTLPLSHITADVDAELESFYVQPNISLIQHNEKVREAEMLIGENVSIRKYIFYQNKLKNVYIQGNPGTGKTTFCTKLALDWCTNVEKRHHGYHINKQEKDDLTEMHFDFLFLISLREEQNECVVENMVKNAIINELNQSFRFQTLFLSKVISKERCLIILDGLDEWSHPSDNDCRRPSKLIPHRATGGNCTFLTLTRPWKLSQIRLRNSDIDILFAMNGVMRPKELVSKVIDCLNRQQRKSLDVNYFMKAASHLIHFLEIPIMSMQLACIWYANGNLPQSKCEIYSTMLEMMFTRHQDKTASVEFGQKTVRTLPNCFSNCSLCQFETEVLEQLGRLAFETLFPDCGRLTNLVFGDKILAQFLEPAVQKSVLSVGLLTGHKLPSLNVKGSQFSFLHKSFQEFLAAFHLATLGDLADEKIQRLNDHKSELKDISEIFIYICGMNPNLALSVSEHLMKKTADMIFDRLKFVKESGFVQYWSHPHYWLENTIETTQKVLEFGFNESFINGHSDVLLSLDHICYNEMTLTKTEVRPMAKLLEINLGRIKTICCSRRASYEEALRSLNQSCENVKMVFFKYIDDRFDLRNCYGLKYLSLVYPMTTPLMLNIQHCKFLEHIMMYKGRIAIQLDANNLRTCRLIHYDITMGNIAEALKDATLLEYIMIHNCKNTTEQEMKPENKSVDLTACRNLRTLEILDSCVTAWINAESLRRCTIKQYDLSQGNLKEALKGAKDLLDFDISECTMSQEDVCANDSIHIDLTLCCALEILKVSHCDIKLSVSALSLRDCSFIGIDVSNGNIAKALKQAKKLNTISITECYGEALHLDLSECDNLETIHFAKCTIDSTINSQNLRECTLRDFHVLEGNILQSLQKAQKLKSLILHKCFVNSNDSLYALLDMTACSSLETLEVIACNISVNVGSPNLRTLALKGYDLSCGNIHEKLEQSISMYWLKLDQCVCSGSGKGVCIDLSACVGISVIEVTRSELSIKYRNHIIGNGQTSWTRYEI